MLGWWDEIVAVTDNLTRDNSALVQRLEDMARVSGRLAHDFDNILTGVIGFTELTQAAAPPGPAQSHLAELRRVGEQGIELTRRLHQLGRSGGVRPVAQPLTGVLADLQRRCRKTLPANVMLEFRLPEDLPGACVDANAIGTAVEELLSNAVEACPTGGRVEVSAQRVALSQADCGRLLGQATGGEYICITIADSGPGIPASIRARLFAEPCFTTKPRHRGLGLPIAFRILYAHHGGLSLDSRGEGGTAARVYLPVAGEQGTVSPT
jgi:signal transduction histidine kinase